VWGSCVCGVEEWSEGVGGVCGGRREVGRREGQAEK